ncbi:peptidoglycan DD-metalloendopeptidase family protein [Massilia sp. CF038]|uniref:peptidoglycan DD-metalloendopeptidase family protein n=1 Tax=Massilia sp. CF038 TaxID=1881045 RepID=UPI0009124192|nr:peptidoglycan DD-metalloendopeptidase family protein [Massilia sp. CF038]SHG53362.1 lipoprotein NlpD [Massilia sp. CF038]
MKQLSQLTLLTLVFGLLSACTSTGRHAPVEERKPASHESRPSSSAAEEPKDERGFYTVKKGDTLLRIALDYGQNYRDLVVWNNLANPNDIKVDQVLRVAPPDGASGSGVQTLPVAAAPEIKPVQPPVPRKTSPKGDKKPYSEAALADARGETGARADKDDKDDKPAKPVAATVPSASGIAAGSMVTATDDDKLSWMWPSDGKIVATFDEGKNKGIDIGGKAGQQVMAASSGKVMYAGSGIRGYGNLVIVKHSNSLLSAYAHNRSITVKEGQSVNKGQVIAEMGDSDADAVKLHFEIRQQGKPVDPSRFLPSR